MHLLMSIQRGRPFVDVHWVLVKAERWTSMLHDTDSFICLRETARRSYHLKLFLKSQKPRSVPPHKTLCRKNFTFTVDLLQGKQVARTESSSK